MDPKRKVRKGFTDHVCQTNGWHTLTLRRLSGAQEVMKKDRHPLPLISEALDSLVGGKYFTKLDIKDAYHNIRIRERDE